MALGRGLDALLGDAQFDYDRELAKNRVFDIKLNEIIPNPFQPRKNFDKDAIRELSQSLNKHGLIQPIVLIKKKDNEFMLVAGERRMRAAKLLGWDKIKAIVLSIDEKNMRELALIENIQRENLNAFELALSLKNLLDEYKITQEELANLVKKSRTWVTNMLRILTLDEKTTNLIAEGKISSGHAKILVGLDKADEIMLADSIVGQKLSVHETENLSRKLKKVKTKKNNLNFDELENKFKEFGCDVKVDKNRIVLSFNNNKEIEKLMQKLSKF